MVLAPAKTKYRKKQRERGRKTKRIESRVTQLAFGSFGLKSLEAKLLKAEQIEAARRVILRFFKKSGKLWIRLFPDFSITSKGTEFSMGGGKGEVVGWGFFVKPGRIIFEVDGVDEETAKKVLKLAASKLPIKTKFVKK